jgi:hypothetical protein
LDATSVGPSWYRSGTEHGQTDVLDAWVGLTLRDFANGQFTVSSICGFLKFIANFTLEVPEKLTSEQSVSSRGAIFLYSDQRGVLDAQFGRASRASADGNRENAFRRPYDFT